MKRTLSINLSGMVFTIDEDAYEELRHYLNNLERHITDDAERKEIVDDIERRISELFSERFSNRKQVISIEDVREVIGILGNPEDIGDAGMDEEGPSQQRVSQGYKRMYRDPDNRVLGGVCGGLGAYLNIDPLVFRILFLLFFFAIGAGLLVYLIMWIVIPEARTRAQKMEMRGEPINFSTIGRNVKEEFEQVKKNMNFGKKNSTTSKS
jgi:phage shock protein PspC (stress-responsive transcriptional regulator)